MALPLFNPGQIVSFTRASHFVAPGAYKVVSALPPSGSEIQYRVRSIDEAFDRIAGESALEASS